MSLVTLGRAQSSELVPGLWVEAKGELVGDQFVASSVEVVDAEDSEVVIGTATRLVNGEQFTLLGQRVSVSKRTKFVEVERSRLKGARIKLEGHWRGPGKFSSRTVTHRGPGRDRLVGRLDAIRPVDGGHRLSLMRWSVFLPADLGIESERPLESYVLTPASESRGSLRQRDDDDDIPGAYRLTEDVRFGARLEMRSTDEREFDLDGTNEEDRLDNQLTVRGEVTWQPDSGERFYGLAGFRGSALWRDDGGEPSERTQDTELTELYGYWRDVGLDGLDVQVGRQDFDDKREWIYDQNLDAVRVTVERPQLRLELSASTTLADGTARDEHSENYIAYLSNNDDNRTLAAWVVDRRDDRGADDYPIHFGARALGEWLPNNDIWAEVAVRRGYRGATDLKGYGFDVGTTWEPDSADPFYFTAGYAFGTGDRNALDGEDDSFRQTGLQDNNARFGGLTSFRYYGELFDPELSNLSVLTLGVGARLTPNTSLDLVYHLYRQDVAADFLVNTDLDRDPNGLSKDIGWEVDLVLGNRSINQLQIEAVLAAFEPGNAFFDDDVAWLAKLQLRYQL